ncbi:MAG: hypothetical protein Tsb0017_07200 [Geothermobacteraceae bacterium]
MKTRLTCVVKTLTLAFFVLFLSASAISAKEYRYLKVNIHAQAKTAKVARASYANYTNPGAGHIIIPVGTKVLIKDKSRKRIVFSYDDDKKEIIFEYHAPRMGMNVDQYLEKITSPNPVSLEGFSELDRKGIAEGKALAGMTREGVMAALGYPAAHRTPSLDAPTWIYWTNRFGTLAVDFDKNGKVQDVRN